LFHTIRPHVILILYFDLRDLTLTEVFIIVGEKRVELDLLLRTEEAHIPLGSNLADYTSFSLGGISHSEVFLVERWVQLLLLDIHFYGAQLVADVFIFE